MKYYRLIVAVSAIFFLLTGCGKNKVEVTHHLQTKNDTYLEGQLTDQQIFEYDEELRLDKKTVKYVAFHVDGQVNATLYDYVYNDDNYLIKCYVYNNDVLTSVIRYEYNGNELVADYYSLSEGGESLIGKTVTERDDAFRIIKMDFYDLDENGDYLKRGGREYTYNDNGFDTVFSYQLYYDQYVLRSIQYDFEYDGMSKTRTTGTEENFATFFDNGNVTHSIREDFIIDSKTISDTQHEYDEKGYPIFSNYSPQSDNYYVCYREYENFTVEVEVD